jgi:hypothetical protein
MKAVLSKPGFVIYNANEEHLMLPNHYLYLARKGNLEQGMLYKPSKVVTR